MTETQALKISIDPTDCPPLKICFVCTGNTCRSPMAMAVLNHLGKGRYIAESAGIMAEKGAPINPKAKTALENNGIPSTPENNYNTHEARQLNEDIIKNCDRVIAVGAGHAMMIMQLFPLYASKISAFEKNITDPFGQSQEVYDITLKEIKECIKNDFLLAEDE